MCILSFKIRIFELKNTSKITIFPRMRSRTVPRSRDQKFTGKSTIPDSILRVPDLDFGGSGHDFRRFWISPPMTFTDDPVNASELHCEDLGPRFLRVAECFFRKRGPLRRRKAVVVVGAVVGNQCYLLVGTMAARHAAAKPHLANPRSRHHMNERKQYRFRSESVMRFQGNAG